MKRALVVAALASAVFLSAPQAFAGQFQHVVLIVQENRTPDNLFYALCTTPTICSTTPTSTQYDIQTSNWLNKLASGGVTQPAPVELAAPYDISHTHASWSLMCDPSSQTGACQMDGAGLENCVGTCPANPQFAYVDNTQHEIDPYIALATQYGWANYMFQTNQGPSFPAHQFLFGATSAPSAADDHAGTFAAENGPKGTNDEVGCAGTPGVLVQLIDAEGVEDPNNKVPPCFEHKTLADALKTFGLTWRYYTPHANYIWTAPNAIDHICEPANGKCAGRLFQDNVALNPAHVLKDIADCKLRNVSWVIPTGQNSDHPKITNGGGPSWVASVVNAIGTSPCTDGSTSYWDDTAIIITWDDWGGWYDHEVPQFLPYPEGGYQYGFRVPLIVVSAYTPQAYINNRRLDDGAIARFVEQNFGIPEGYLTFADARTKKDLVEFFNFTMTPRPFSPITTRLHAKDFLNDKSPPLPPDDD